MNWISASNGQMHHNKRHVLGAAVDMFDPYNLQFRLGLASMDAVPHISYLSSYLCSVRQAECLLRVWPRATRCEQLRRSTAGLSRSLNPTILSALEDHP